LNWSPSLPLFKEIPVSNLPELPDREKFEAWADRNGFHLGFDGYSYPRVKTQIAWNSWQEAVKQERELCAQAAEEVDEPGWTGYECPNTFNDGKWAAAAAIRSRGVAP
jgi:hypothetical protein